MLNRKMNNAMFTSVPKLRKQWEHFGNSFANKLYGNIKVSIYVYALLKYIFYKNNVGTHWFLKLLTILVLSPAVFVTVWFFKWYRWLIKQIIAAEDGTRFYRLLDGTEALFCIEQDPPFHRPLVGNLFFIEFEGDAEEFRRICVAEIRRVFQLRKFRKMMCTMEYRLGYYYYQKFYSRLEEFFHTLPVPIASKNGHDFNIYKTIGKVFTRPMPYSNKALWDVHISNGRVNDEYLLFIRLHHSFGDATSFFNMFSREFQLKHSEMYSSTANENCLNIRGLTERYKENPFIMATGLTDTPDNNTFNNQCGDKHTFWYIDREESTSMMKTVKAIKKNYPRSTFTSIILTVFMKTLSDHLRKKELAIPDKLCVMIPMIPSGNVVEYGKCPDYQLGNSMTLGIIRLPLQMSTGQKSGEKKSFLKLFEGLNQEYNCYKNKSLDREFNRWQGRIVLTFLPHLLPKWLVGKYGPTLLVSNIPGCKSLTFFGKLKVTNYVTLDPNCSTAGVSLMVTSYEGRLNFAYTIDEKAVPEFSDIRGISENFINNLNLLKDLV